MKKLRLVCALMGAMLLAGIVCPGVSALAAAVMLPMPETEGTPLKTEDVVIRADLTNGRLEASMLLSNLSTEEAEASDWTGEIELPGLAEAAAEGTAVVLVNGEAARYAGQSLSVTVPAEGETQIDWACDLADFRKISYLGVELASLVYGENDRIGHISVDFVLDEADVPLVTEITPVNYTYDVETRTVNVTLYDFAPSVILDRISLTRDPWEDVIANREFEPNEEQLFCARHYKEWLENGIENVEESYWPGDAFEIAFGIDPNMEWDDWQERAKIGYYALDDNTDLYIRLYHYIYYRDRMDELSPEKFTGTGYALPILLGDMYAATGEMTTEAFCVSEVSNPSLAEDELTVEVTTRYEWDDEAGCCVYEYENRVVSEQACLETPEGENFVVTDVLPSHILVIPLSAGASTEEILDACEALRVSMIVRMMLFDGVREEIPTYSWRYLDYDEYGNEIEGPEERDIVGRYTAYSGEENYEMAKIVSGMVEEEYSYDSLALVTTDDPVVVNADVPAFLLYRGYTYRAEPEEGETEGRIMVNFWDNWYLGYESGLTRHALIRESERGQELAEAAEARLAAKVEAVRPVTETQFPDPESLPEAEAGTAENPGEDDPDGGEASAEEKKSGEPSETADVQPSETAGMPTWLIPACLGGAIVLSAGLVILTVSLAKKRKKSRRAPKHTESRKNQQ